MTDGLYFQKWFDGDVARDVPSVPASKASPIVRESITAPEGYIPTRELANAVNVALLLGKPLLVTGPPGTGKTQLASAIALEMRDGSEALTVHKFETKSTSVARDLFYTYDAIAAFREKEQRDARYFISYQALGKAILESFAKDEVEDFLSLPDNSDPHDFPRRSVVLIDEIDKAPRDFPNDLLNEIERFYFRVPELGNRGTPGADGEVSSPSNALRPIVIITSNDEKSLPEPFMRRCVFFEIAPHTGADLRRIVEARLPEVLKDQGGPAEEAIKIFETLRESKRFQSGLSTAELLDWIQILSVWPKEDAPIAQQADLLRATLPALLKSKREQDDALKALTGGNPG